MSDARDILAHPKGGIVNRRSNVPASDPNCDGICLSAADVGVPEAGDVVASADPCCSVHGDRAGEVTA